MMNASRFTALLAIALATLVGMMSNPAHASLIDVTNPLNELPGAGRTITVSSSGVFGDKTALIDNLATSNDADGSFLFGQTDSPNRLSISGFNGAHIGIIRIFTAADPTREPTSITVKSSISLVTTLTAGDYETALGTFTFTPLIPLSPYVPADPTAASRGYFDLDLSTPAPVGTQSLFLSLVAPISGIRIYELQAIETPEPASVTLLGAAGALALLRRRA